MIDAQQAIAAYEHSGGLSAEVRATIASPGKRFRIYQLLQGKALHPFHPLILAMFEQEMLYRKALWEGKAEPEGEGEDAFTGIYRCAFFLYQIGNPADIFVLWQASLLNMDVGSILGVHYFVGAGVNETIAFLKHSDRRESGKILEHIENFFDCPRALDEQREWADARRSDPDNVWL